jgi:hypothetical protein
VFQIGFVPVRIVPLVAQRVPAGRRVGSIGARALVKRHRVWRAEPAAVRV